MEIEETWGDDWSDEEDADWVEDDWDESEDDVDDYTVPCPACGEDVYEDAEQCPACGEYILAPSLNSSYAWRNRPLWWILIAVAGIAAVILTLVF